MICTGGANLPNAHFMTFVRENIELAVIRCPHAALSGRYEH